MANKKIRSFGILLSVIVLILLNMAASQWHARLDLTNEKRFTLSRPTKQLLRKVEDVVSIQVFLKGNYPSGFKQLATATADILQEFKEQAGNNIRYTFISPEDNIEGTEGTFADSLSAMGMYPINMTSQVKEGQQQQFIYPVALVHYKEKSVPVILFQGKTPAISFEELNSAEALLEYRLADAISKVIRTTIPLVAYTTGNGEPMGFNVYDMVENTLKPNYNLATFNLHTHSLVPAEIQTLIIVKPVQPFTDAEKFKLDQYVMNGGKLLIFYDRLNAEMDSLQIKNEVIAYDRNLGLNDLVFKYGARVNPDLLMDLQSDFLPFDVSGNGQFTLLRWNYFPMFTSSSNHPINKNLGFVSGKFVNSIDTIEAEGIRKTILLTSSANARTISTPALISPLENVNAPENDKFKKAGIPIAVLLEGKFKSLYANRVSQAMIDTLALSGAVFKKESTDNGKIILVSDGDIVLNAVVKGNQPLPMGMNQYTYGTQQEFTFANREFFQNCLDYLINENDLSEAKAKDYVARLLNGTKVKEEKTMWQVINIAVPVITVILFAIIFQWYRRKRFSI